jgi:hypothetical protein
MKEQTNMEDQELKDLKEVASELSPVEQKENWTSIDLYYKGFHIKKSISANTSKETLIKMIDEYAEKGFEPSWNSATSKEHLSPAQTVQSAPTNVPVCQIHQMPMTWKTGVSKTTNKPYAFWSCSGKMPNGTWCSYKPQ